MRLRAGAFVVVVAVAVFGAGCAHTVTVTANTDDAAIRVDGKDIGTVGEGATFVERWGASRAYDIEATAPGHHLTRLQVKPTVVDAKGAPWMVSTVGGCCTSSCITPFVALALWDYAVDPASIVPRVEAGPREGEVDTDAAWDVAGLWTGAIGIYVCTGVSIWAVSGAQRLPDEVYVELPPEIGGVDSGLPPPPKPAPKPAPAPPTMTPTTPAPATMTPTPTAP